MVSFPCQIPIHSTTNTPSRPALRDRLVRHHNYYFATTEFATHYREHFKFSWPFGFDETYRYNPSTKSYRISPLFERYHRDMRCWSMEEVFFQKFPELVGEMSVHQLDPLDMSSSSTGTMRGRNSTMVTLVPILL